MDRTIPEDIITILLDMAPDDASRRYRRIMLSPDACSATAQLAEALASPGIRVCSGVCDTEPNEICVSAYGRTRSGSVWLGTTILILDPEWDRDADMAQSLADDFVDLWDQLRAAAGPEDRVDA